MLHYHINIVFQCNITVSFQRNSLLHQLLTLGCILFNFTTIPFAFAVQRHHPSYQNTQTSSAFDGNHHGIVICYCWTGPSMAGKQFQKEKCWELALCTAALLPELQPAPCFLSSIIGQID